MNKTLISIFTMNWSLVQYPVLGRQRKEQRKQKRIKLGEEVMARVKYKQMSGMCGDGHSGLNLALMSAP